MAGDPYCATHGMFPCSCSRVGLVVPDPNAEGRPPGPPDPPRCPTCGKSYPWMAGVGANRCTCPRPAPAPSHEKPCESCASPQRELDDARRERDEARAERDAFVEDYALHKERLNSMAGERDAAIRERDEARASANLYVCVACGFAFPRHVRCDAEGGYSCPVCAEYRLADALAAARRQVEALKGALERAETAARAWVDYNADRLDEPGRARFALNYLRGIADDIAAALAAAPQGAAPHQEPQAAPVDPPKGGEVA